MSNNTLKRYNSIRRADQIDDQMDSSTVSTAHLLAETQEEFQNFILSRIRQLMYGDVGGHWYDDLFDSGTGILPLKDISEALAEGGIVSTRVRTSVPLVGVKNGQNRVFRTSPDHFVHDLVSSGKSIQVWHNGRLLVQSGTSDPGVGDYTVLESGGVGTGFDAIKLLTFAPVGRSRLVASYQRT